MRSFWKHAPGVGLTCCLAAGLWASEARAATDLVSANAAGEAGNGSSIGRAMSADGHWVAFSSRASDLVPDDTTHYNDLFVKNLTTGEVRRVSVTASGEPANGDVGNHCALSADGGVVAFVSYATNLVAGDLSPSPDVFVKDLATGEVRMASSAADGTPGSGPSQGASLSADGKIVAFQSIASNLAPGGGFFFYNQIFVKDLTTGAVRHVSVSPTGQPGDLDSSEASLSADGKTVAFVSLASNLVEGDTNGKPDVFVADLTTGAIRRASTAADGVQGDADGGTRPSLSADGKAVAFMSNSHDLVPGITNDGYNVFVKDLTTGAIRRVSVTASGEETQAHCLDPSLSGDGKVVAFPCFGAGLVPGDANNQEDVFVKDLESGAVRIASVSSDGVQGNNVSDSPLLNANGSVLAFTSYADNLAPGDKNTESDVFVTGTGFGGGGAGGLPGPPVITALGVTPGVPYAPGGAVTVAADVSSALPLTNVAARWGAAPPVDLTLTGGHWTGPFTFPPTHSPQWGVTVTATDNQGRTAVRGLLLPLVQPAPPPNTDWVFLVHGFAALEPGPHPWYWDAFYNDLKARLACPDDGSAQAECDGTKVPGFQPTVRVLKVDGMDSNASDEANAAALAAFVHAQPFGTGDRVFLIGHDTGGTIGRIYLSKYKTDPLHGPDVARVARLVQAGTPNAGTPIATDAAARALLDPAVASDLAEHTPVLFDAAEPGATLLNLRYDHGGDAVPFSFVSAECDAFTCSGNLNGSFLYLLPLSNDGAVPVSSARSIATARDYVPPPLAGVDHAGLLSSSAGANAILAALFPPPGLAPASRPAPLQIASKAQTLDSLVRHLPAGESLTLPLHFEGEKLVLILANFLTSAGDAVLNGPAGPIPALGQFAHSAYWFIDEPVAGEYSLTLKGMGVNGLPTDALVTYGSATATGFMGEVSPPLVAAQPVLLRAVLASGSYQPAVTTVTAKVALVGGTPAPAVVELKDDGGAPDVMAGDGTFTGAYQPAGVGRYSVEFTASGKYADGRDLDRTAASYFEERWLAGDVNGDLGIDVLDAVLTLQIIVGLAIPDGLQRGAADVNGDAQITVEDAVLILRRIVFGEPLGG